MKYTFIIILALFLIFGCKSNKVEELRKTVKIDTTYFGNPGKSGYSISIYHKIDSVTTEYHERYLNDYKKLDIKDQYMDEKGQMRFIYFSYNPDKNRHRVSYSWDDKWGRSVISVDSEYVNNKLKSLEVTVGKENQISLDKIHSIFEKKYSNGRLKEFVIHDFDRNYNYSEEGNNIWELATDVPPEYAEWRTSSKYAFGRSLSDATNYLVLAFSRIDSTYLQIAKDKHSFDLTSFIKEGRFKK